MTSAFIYLFLYYAISDTEFCLLLILVFLGYTMLDNILGKIKRELDMIE